jgi:fibronectin type 3 domain-containing protein
LKRIPSLWPLAGIRPAAKPVDGPMPNRKRRVSARVIALLVAAVAAPLALFWVTSVAVSAGDAVVEIESLTIPSTSGAHVFTDSTASGGKAVSWWSNDTLTGSVTTTASTTTLTLRARSDLCNGGATAVVAVDGTTVLTATATTATWADYSSAVNIPAGTHSFSISYTNDTKTSTCDRNLRTDKLTFVGGSSGGGGDTTPPNAPTGLGATAGDTKVTLGWNANSESDLAGYNVYRATTSGGSYTKVNGSLVTSTSYVDTSVANGTKYYYVVRAVDTSTNSSGNSNEASATPTAGPDTTPPPVPSGLTATAGDGSASLGWGAVSASDLAGYNLYRSTTSGGPYSTKVNSSLITGTSFSDSGLTNGTTYYYVVRSVDSSSNESGNSNQTSAAPTVGGGGGGGSSTIEAESFTIPSTSGAHVYNDTSASGGKAVSFWSNDTISTTVSTVAGTSLVLRAYGDQCNGAPTAVIAMDGATVMTQSASGATWTNYSVPKSISAGSHTFSISYTNDTKTSTCDRNLRVDSLTVATGTGGGDTTPPSAPISLGATPGDSKVTLTWAANTESDLAGYNIYRSTTSGTGYSKLNGSSLLTSASYTDTTAVNGTKYFYVVRAVDTSGNSSGNSNEASATPTAGPDITPPPVPTGLGASAGNGSATLTWSPVSAGDLAGYNVYRGTTSGGPYSTKVNGSSLVGSTTYTDSGLTNGTTYYYVVRSIDASSNESGNSSQTSATPTSGGGGGGSTTIEAENFTIPSTSAAHVYSDTSASGGKAVSFWSNDTISTTVTTVAGTRIVARAFGDQCSGAPNVVIGMDGSTVLTAAASAGSWTNYTASKTVSAGSHTFSITYNNDFSSSTCDRNLRIDSVTVDNGSTGPGTPMLPDLVQEPPTQVSITQSSASYRLGFNSAVENHGAGPLIVNGHRASTATSAMTADQIVNLTDGTTQTISGVGSIAFYAPHNHWHYSGFDKYELRKSSDNSLVAPDQKNGFCLGDRYTPNSDGSRNENPPTGPFTFNNCAPGDTSALNVTEGISVGYGDEYEPQLEGQYIDVTGVQPGNYLIVHRTNSDGALHETDTSNDVASVLVSMWPNGYGNLTGGGVTVLKTCPGTATCSLSASAPSPQSFRHNRWGIPVGGLPFQLRHSPPPDDPPLLVKPAARFYAHLALQRIVGAGSSKAKVRCASSSRRAARCVIGWRVNRSTYSGTLDISLPKKNNQYWWVYSARLVRKDASGIRHINRAPKRVFVPRQSK